MSDAAYRRGMKTRRKVLGDAWVDRAERTGHPDFQALINAALHDYICRVEEPLERTLRRVLREELRKAG